MTVPTTSVSQLELAALHLALVEARAQLAAAGAELRRLQDEEFVHVRVLVNPEVAGGLGAWAARVAEWLKS